MVKKIIAVANQKGGVGKTTTTVNFAYELSKKGYKVLCVDMDSQGNLSNLLLGHEDNIDDLEETICKSFFECIEGNKPNLYIYKSNCENVDIMPSNINMADVKLSLNNSLVIARETILKRILEEVKDKYDYVIIDTAPSLDIDLVNTFVASDEIIIPVTPDTLSTAGTRGLLRTYKLVKQNLNNNLEIKGMLATNVDMRTKFSQEMLELLKEIWNGEFKIFNTYIPKSIKVPEGQAFHEVVSTYDNKNKVAIAYKEFAEEYLR